jgi:hypothetical protein
VGIIGATFWLGVLTQRVLQLEKNPLLEAVKEMQRQQIIDVVRKLSEKAGL